MGGVLPQDRGSGSDRQGAGVDVDLHGVPVVDADVLFRLRVEFDVGGGIWTVFVQDFLARLPGRVEWLRRALTSGDALGARDALVVLRTSCQMVGAVRLAEFAVELEQSVRVQGRAVDATVVLPRLAALQLSRIRRGAQLTEVLLTSYLQGRKRL